ncbi:17362_t:CDS:2, partial [Gigaspora margarita]
FKPSEKITWQIEGEALAIKAGVYYFLKNRTNNKDQHLIIYTDTQWLARKNGLNLQLKFVPGKNNPADQLTRSPTQVQAQKQRRFRYYHQWLKQQVFEVMVDENVNPGTRLAQISPLQNKKVLEIAAEIFQEYKDYDSHDRAWEKARGGLGKEDISAAEIELVDLVKSVVGDYLQDEKFLGKKESPTMKKIESEVGKIKSILQNASKFERKAEFFRKLARLSPQEREEINDTERRLTETLHFYDENKTKLVNFCPSCGADFIVKKGAVCTFSCPEKQLEMKHEEISVKVIEVLLPSIRLKTMVNFLHHCKKEFLDTLIHELGHINSYVKKFDANERNILEKVASLRKVKVQAREDYNFEEFFVVSQEIRKIMLENEELFAKYQS